MKNVFFAVLTAICMTSILPAKAQEMKSAQWSAFGVLFNVPVDITIEDDSEEGFVLSNEDYYVNVQILDGEAMDKDAMTHEIKQIADDDQLQEQSPITKFNLPQFHGVQLHGTSEGEIYLYNYLMAKDESCGFFVTVIYNDKADEVPQKIIESFQLEE